MVPASDETQCIQDALLIAGGILVVTAMGFYLVMLTSEKWLTRKKPGFRALLLQARMREKKKREVRSKSRIHPDGA